MGESAPALQSYFSKAAAERLILTANNTLNFLTVALRLPIIYGEQGSFVVPH